MKLSNYEYIIFDFNGTILDDVDLCINILNYMLEEHGYQKITKERYLEIFTFPIIEYYKLAGFDFNKYSFNDLSIEFINMYQQASLKCPLYEGVIHLLETLNKLNKKIILLSASQIDNLLEQTNHFDITKYFNHVLGLDNIHARSKVDIAKKFFIENNIDLSKAIMIGDTIHDMEVANELNIDSILIANGHQSYDRLIKLKNEVYKTIKEINI